MKDNKALENAAFAFVKAFEKLDPNDIETTKAKNRASTRLFFTACLSVAQFVDEIKLLDGGAFAKAAKPVVAFLRENANGILDSMKKWDK